MRFFYLALLIIFLTNYAFASEPKTVLLDVSEIKSFKVPDYSPIVNERINYRGEVTDKEDYDSIYNLDSDEELFETKTGQIFSKFVNEKAINNKINKFTSGIEKELYK